MKAFFLLVVLVAAAVAEEAAKVEVKPSVVEAKAVEASVVDQSVELGSRSGADDIGERSGVYPTPYASYYWPHSYYVPLAAPSQLARSEHTGVVAAAPYYPYPYYGYPQYYAPAVVLSPPAPPAHQHH